ncbi:MAG: hypothetical protein KGI00_00200 [Candidatus Micrarchaeota archaeon]|nr:hypothetical protein [Candidatus Micrarchaeota archaeon]MDE1849136.1 hypothetical protein [Candidatus Micrarchaeota archaeon]
MASKKSGKSRSSKKLQAFNRSQEIYKLLEKGIIVNEALSSSTGDRPEEDAHVSDLLEVASEKEERKSKPGKARMRRKAKRR